MSESDGAGSGHGQPLLEGPNAKVWPKEVPARDFEADFQTLVERLPLAITLSSGLEQICNYVNPRFVELFGYTLEEVPTVEHWWPLAYPDEEYRRWVMTTWMTKVEEATATQSPIVTMEVVVQCKDGSRREVEWGFVPLGDGSRGAPGNNFAYGLDITEKRRAARAHLLSAEVLRLLNEATSFSEAASDILAAVKRDSQADVVGIRLLVGEDFPYIAQDGFTSDFLLTENSLTVRDDEGNACRGADGKLRLGCTCGLVISGRTDPSFRLFTPGGSCWTNDSRELLSIPADQELRIRPRNVCVSSGFSSIAIIPLRAGREIVGVLHLNSFRGNHFSLEQIQVYEGLGHNIGSSLARRRADAELERQAHQLRTVGRIARVGGWEIDVETMRLTWSEEVFRLHEVEDDYVPTVEKAIGFYVPEHVSAIEKAVGEAIRFGKPFDLVLGVITAKGRRREVAAKGEAEMQDGKTVTVWGTFQDVTEKLQTEATLARVQKLESLGTLAGGIAHDFNNILTAIQGNLSLLRSLVHDQGESHELFEEVQSACQNAAGLAAQLLTFSSGGTPIVEVIDLRPVLQRTATFATRGTASRCVFELGDQRLLAKADPTQVAQVIQNLVLNAAQSMTKGGNITVAGTIVELAEAAVPPLQAGRHIRLSVSDEGSGIAPEVLPRVFDPFFTTRDDGRGLGLAVCHSIMAKHGGHISVESTPGVGTRFVLYFPAAETQLFQPTGEAGRPESTRKVLLMDDDAAIARVLTRILRRLGCEVETVVDGEAALVAYRTATESGRRFDLVILDLTIPGGMGGKEAQEKLLAIDPEVKSIVSSGYFEDPVMADYLGHGFRAVLPKPYNLEQVAEVMLRVLER